MKLFYSQNSPFVRRSLVVAHEKGLADQVEIIRAPVQMTKPNLDLMKVNPLGKVPALVLDSGQVLIDSAVICDYFDAIGTGVTLIPTSSSERWTQLTWAALGVGMADILLLLFRERMRPQAGVMQELESIFQLKILTTVAHLSSVVDQLRSAEFGIGQIAICCALDYLDFRFPDLPWRDEHKLLAEWSQTVLARPSFQATDPRLGTTKQPANAAG